MNMLKNVFNITYLKPINTTPNCILDKIETHSLQGYTGYFKKITLESYQIDCLIPHCYICSRN